MRDSRADRDARVASPSGTASRLTVWDSTQGVYPIQSGVAQALQAARCRSVRVIGHYMGGGFGSEAERQQAHGHRRAAGQEDRRGPVKLHLTREESFLAVGNRPPNAMTIKAGVKKDGTLTALQMTVLGTGGAYPAAASAAWTGWSATSTPARTCRPS